jgi:hypothetical protein
VQKQRVAGQHSHKDHNLHAITSSISKAYSEMKTCMLLHWQWDHQHAWRDSVCMRKLRPTRSTGGQSKARFCGRAMPVQAHESLHLSGLHGTTSVGAHNTGAIGAANCGTAFDSLNVIHPG